MKSTLGAAAAEARARPKCERPTDHWAVGAFGHCCKARLNGRCRTRTCDIHDVNVALYQLS